MVNRPNEAILEPRAAVAFHSIQHCIWGQGIVGQLDCDNSTVDKLYRLYSDCKDKSYVKKTILIFRRVVHCRTTLIGYHPCVYRVRVIHISQCARNAGCQVVLRCSPTKCLISHIEASLVLSTIQRDITKRRLYLALFLSLLRQTGKAS